MAKKLSTQTKLKRLRAEGYSRKDLARSFGVSVSSIGRAERGAKGTTIGAQVDQFFKLSKRAKANVVSGQVSLPSAKPAPVKASKKEQAAPPIVSPLTRAEGQLSQLDGDTMVMVQMTMADGKVRVFYAKGGIEASDIKGNLEDALDDQAARQGRNHSLRSMIDWGEVRSIDVFEYRG